MPLLNNQFSVLRCKCLGLGQVIDLQTLGFSQLHTVLDIEYSFSSSAANMHVDRTVLVALEKEQEPFFLENSRHMLTMPGDGRDGEFRRSNDPKLSDGGAWRGSCVVGRSEGIQARERGGSDETRPDKK